VQAFPGLKLVTPPAEEPITLAQAKEHLRVSDASQDGKITRAIAAARRDCEAYLGRALVTQAWDLALPRWPCAPRVVLPRPPVQSVTSITYLDASGASVVLSAGEYKVRAGTPGVVSLRSGRSWPSLLAEDDAVVIRFVAGYGAASAVPESLVEGMLLRVGTLYEHREDVVVGTVAAKLDEVVMRLWDSEAWGGFA
jgi:uncharacterized phiE125 gp8 family phage protein